MAVSVFVGVYLMTATTDRMRKSFALAGTTLLLASGAVAATEGQPDSTTSNTQPSGSAAHVHLERTTYSNPAEASQALFEAVNAGDLEMLARILGSPDELLSSENADADKEERARFVRNYQQMHRLVRRTDGTVALYIGADNWPFPVPLVERDDRWLFDTDAGLREILYRRVGENEVAAIELCDTLLRSQRSAATHHPNETNQDPAALLIDSLLSAAHDGGGPVRFHGYEFRVLEPSHKDFTVVAYPASYRSSGVMTFVAERDTVYEKDLGPDTTRAAQALTSARPDRSWSHADPDVPPN
jgi:Protein of unknown function (DUF2950)